MNIREKPLKLRWYTVGKNTIQAGSPGEARRIIQDMERYRNKTGTQPCR
jgi:hypothetical protein